MNTSKTTISFNSLYYNSIEQYVERISLFLENLIFLKIDLFVNNFNQDFHLGEVSNPVFFKEMVLVYNWGSSLRIPPSICTWGQFWWLIDIGKKFP